MSHYAVLDVGKTNKKILIFDEQLRIVDEVYASIPADESAPVHIERVQDSADWFLDQLPALTAQHDIRAVSVTAHGATFVCVDEAGAPAFPVVAYTTDPGAGFSDRFYARCGEKARALHARLATPDMGALACVAKGIAFAQEHYGDEFQRVAAILCLPQFFSFLLTGKAGAETTYMACHTYLWDFAAADYSDVVDALGVRALMPTPVRHAADVLGTVAPDIAARTGLGADVVVTHGIHDSNASLLPFLIQNDEPFVLNSTGTWCVMMCPTENATLTEAEMDAGAFCNCDANGRPVKTAVVMAGAEHDRWWRIISDRTGTTEMPAFDPALVQSVLDAADTFVLPGVMPGTGPFPACKSAVQESGTRFTMDDIASGAATPNCFESAERAYALLCCALAMLSCEQLSAVGTQDGMPIYIEGGFRKNAAYQALLAALFPNSPIYLTDMKEATAFGAALLARAAVERCALADLRPDFKIDATPVDLPRLANVQAYRHTYAEQARKS